MLRHDSFYPKEVAPNTRIATYPKAKNYSTNATSATTILKEGWVFKRAGSSKSSLSSSAQSFLLLPSRWGSLLSIWHAKYLVLETQPRKGLVLKVFDNLDQFKGPKYDIRVDDITEIMCPAPDNGGGIGKYGRFAPNKSSSPMVIYTTGRKFYFAAQTKGDRDEWIAKLEQGFHGNQPSSGLKPAMSHGYSHLKAKPYLSVLQDDSQYTYNDVDSRQSVGDPAETLSYRDVTERSDYPDDDNVSVYSVTQAASNQHIYEKEYRGTANEIADDQDDDAASVTFSIYSRATSIGVRSVANSSVGSLSFHSELVLTPTELAKIGHSALVFDSAYRGEDAFTAKELVRKKKFPVGTSGKAVKPGLTWNQRYQEKLGFIPKTEEESRILDVDLVEIIGEFRETATRQIKQTIDEFHLFGNLPPSSHRSSPAFGLEHNVQQPSLQNETSQMVTMFTLDSICYEFAANYSIANQGQLTKGHCRASAELRSIDAVNSSMSGCDAIYPRLHTPLMIIVDYKGFRVIAYADMQFDQHQSIPVFSTSSTPVRTDEHAGKFLIAAGGALNLKPHIVQVSADRRIPIHMSVGTQVRFDRDTNRFYASNLHELFPLDFYVPAPSGSESKNQTSTHDIKGPSGSNSGNSYLISSNQDSAPVFYKRLRPEFIQSYEFALSADALTQNSAATAQEAHENDSQVIRASRFLRESVIPAFVQALDQLMVRPQDSRSWTGEMHAWGINTRYLGHIAQLSTLPYIREMARIEMVARAAKCILRAKLRQAVLHFKSIGATNIETDMKAYATQFFNSILILPPSGNKNIKFFDDKLREEIAVKFNYSIDYKTFAGLYRPALFLALQYHTCIYFTEKSTFDFQDPLDIADFQGFIPKIKQLKGLPRPRVQKHQPQAMEEEYLGYQLSRQLKSLGPQSKLARTNVTAISLCETASFYNHVGRVGEAKVYSEAAIAVSSRSSIYISMALGQLIQAQIMLDHQNGVNQKQGPSETVIRLYKEALAAFEWHWGYEHPLTLFLHDMIAECYFGAQSPDRALQLFTKNYQIVRRELGESHKVTAGYLVKIACLNLGMGKTDEASKLLSDAMQIYTSSFTPDTNLIAEVHFHFANCCLAKGDLKTAVDHAQNCRRLRETLFGQNDPRSVESFRQTATLIMAPYRNYSGVLTPLIKQAYKEAIVCHEKVFRYLKSVKKSKGKLNPVTLPFVKAANVSFMPQSLTMTAFLGTSSCPALCGPLVTSPIIPVEHISRSLLHKLTKEIVSLKLALIESPTQKEVVRLLKAKFKQRGGSSLSSETARAVILRLAAVSPSVYLDALLVRIDDEDWTAQEELGDVLQLIDSDTIQS